MRSTSGVVGAAALRGEERALEVDPGDLALRDEPGEQLDPLLEHPGRGGDQAREHRRGALRPVGVDGRATAGQVGVGEPFTPAPVVVHVDQAGQHPRRRPLRYAGRRDRRGRAGPADAAPLDEHRSVVDDGVLQHDPSPEDLNRGACRRLGGIRRHGYL